MRLQEDDDDKRQEDKNTRKNTQIRAEKEKTKKTTWLPPANIDWEGEQDPNFQPTSKRQPQQYDWTTVKLPRRKKETRPQMSQTMNEDVEQKYQQHLENKYAGKDIKTKPQKPMQEETRQKTIQQLLAKSGLMVGVGPITPDHIKRVQRALEFSARMKLHPTGTNAPSNL